MSPRSGLIFFCRFPALAIRISCSLCVGFEPMSLPQISREIACRMLKSLLVPFLIHFTREAGRVQRRFYLRPHLPFSASSVLPLHRQFYAPRVGHSSVTTDPFSIITLPLPPGDGACALSDMMYRYFQAETLSGRKIATCSRCAQKAMTKKELHLHTAPSLLLIIYLKRFNNRGTPRCNPVTFSLVNFQL